MASAKLGSPSLLLAKRPLAGPSLQKRFSHDLVIKRATGRPIIRSGPTGRHAQTGHTATVFGCTGFLGRYLVHKLAKQGTQVVVPYRDADEQRHLKVMGDLGQIVALEWDIRNDSQIEECVRHSDIVYNLVGRDYETKNFKYPEVHVEGARRIARISALSGVSRFVHVSHLNADHNSPSKVYRAKAQGEDAVSEAYPGATIVRPAWMYGHEDRLLNTVATNPVVFRVNHGDTLIKPVHVLDVAQALHLMMDAESTIGQTFSLPGPKTYSYNDIIAMAETRILKKLGGVSTPRWMASMATRLWENVWWPTISPDEVVRRYMDDKDSAPGTLGFADLGITPDILEDIAIVYLRRYRSSAYYDQPIESGGVKLRSQRYHVIDS